MASALHPLDPLTADEIALAIATVKEHHGECFFNVVSLHEPPKAEMLTWLDNPSVRPARVADIVVIVRGGKVYDGLVNLQGPTIIKWELMEGVQPIVCPVTLPTGELSLTAPRSPWRSSSL